MWSKYIDQSLELYADDCDVLFASHHWPRWGRAELSVYLASQRDAYRYLHDQTLRLANHGRTMDEIAEETRAARGVSATSSSIAATTERSRTTPRPSTSATSVGSTAIRRTSIPIHRSRRRRRYVAFMGGADAVLDRARASFAEGDYRWVVEVVNHVVFADPDNEAARLLQADALEQLGYQSESGPWRDFYLRGRWNSARTGPS